MAVISGVGVRKFYERLEYKYAPGCEMMIKRPLSGPAPRVESVTLDCPLDAPAPPPEEVPELTERQIAAAKKKALKKQEKVNRRVREQERIAKGKEEERKRNLKGWTNGHEVAGAGKDSGLRKREREARPDWAEQGEIGKTGERKREQDLARAQKAAQGAERGTAKDLVLVMAAAVLLMVTLSLSLSLSLYICIYIL